MGYGRLGASEPEPSDSRGGATSITPPLSTPRPRSKLKFLIIFSLTLIVASAVSVALVIELRDKSSSSGNNSDNLLHRKPTQSISRTCSKTRFQSLCINSLLDFPGSLTASDSDLVHISVNVTLQRVGRALYSSSEINNLQMDTRVRSAYEDCLELLEDSVDQLSCSLFSVAPSSSDGQGDVPGQKAGGPHDVMTWLSAALTNQDTCTDGLSEVNDGYVKNQMQEKLRDLSELVSNCLAIYSAASGDDDFAGVPIQNRRLMSSSPEEEDDAISEFPEWLSRKERRLLDMPVSAIQADIVVSKDGKNGTVMTIEEAIKKAPEHSNRRIIIYVKAGK